MRYITEMITRRPFARPLFLWIMGILLYVYVPDAWLIPLLLVCWSIPLLEAGVNGFGKRQALDYASRWLSGVPVLLLLLTLSVETCYLRERYPASAFSAWQREAAEVQSILVKRLDQLSLTDAEKSVLATLTLGYRQSMRQAVRQQFAAAGVAHVLAVSGFHVAIVCGALSFVTFFLRHRVWGRWIRYLLLLVGLWGFAFLTGLSPSAVRAALMLTFYLTGKHFGLQVDSYNTLVAAAFCMLVYRPAFLFDVGFQLSFIAVGFILAWIPLFRRMVIVRNPLVAYCWNGLLVALAAQMGTVGLTLYYFKQGSLLFLLTCLPIAAIATCLLPTTWIWLCLPDGCLVASMSQGCLEWLTHAMVRFVECCAALPFATVQWSCDGITLLLIYVLFGWGWLFLYQWSPKRLLGLMSLVLLLFVKIFLSLLDGN